MTRVQKDDAATAGFFNKPITLQVATYTDDGQGGKLPNWIAYGTGLIWAHVDTGRAGKAQSDAVFAGQTYPTNHVTITIRYQPGISPKMRVQYKNKTYTIQEITDPHESNITIELWCVEYQERGT